jgi:outer membrane lipoprotein-sorting protein
MTLLLAAALFTQDKTAEETFKKIEEQIQTAKTLSIKFKVDAKEKQKGMTLTGTAFIRDGNKFSISARMKDQGREEEFSVISDGKQLQRKASTAEPETRDTPKDFVPRFETSFIRTGIILAVMSTLRPSTVEGKEGQDLKKLFSVTDFKNGDDVEGAKTLSYTLRFPETKPDLSGSCILRYDPVTLKVLGRTLTMTGRGADATVFTETYEDFALNADIPDEKFKLPGK